MSDTPAPMQPHATALDKADQYSKYGLYGAIGVGVLVLGYAFFTKSSSPAPTVPGTGANLGSPPGGGLDTIYLPTTTYNIDINPRPLPLTIPPPPAPATGNANPTNLVAHVYQTRIGLDWTPPTTGLTTNEQVQWSSDTGTNGQSDLMLGHGNSFETPELPPGNYQLRVVGMDRIPGNDAAPKILSYSNTVTAYVGPTATTAQNPTVSPHSVNPSVVVPNQSIPPMYNVPGTAPTYHVLTP